MALELYRRNNPQKCSSNDTVVCTNRRRGCPIWASGTKPDGTYLRASMKTRDWASAQKRVRVWEETGTEPKAPAGRATIEALRDRYLANMETTNKNHETIRKYKMLFSQLTAFAEDAGIRFVDELDLSQLESFRSSWKDQNLSRQKKQERLRGIFRYAAKHKMISENPAAELDAVKVHKRQVVPFTDDEIERVLNAAKAHSDKVYAFVLLMRYSGLRISDAAMLPLEQVVGNRLTLRTQKTGKDVSVLLPDFVVKALHSFKPRTPKHFFWTGQSQVHGLTNLYRNNFLKKVFKAAGLTNKPHPHQFRHTFASKLLSSGATVEDVASLLGNTPKIVWKHYAAWVKDRQESLDRAVLRAFRTNSTRIKGVRLDKPRSKSVQKSH
jgi:site-specific recombinase XerD